ncbi:MAG: pyridoxal-phosphate-dependent aminotransferase family protein [Nitrospiraceae bacterium]
MPTRFAELSPPSRILLGPGPSMVHSRVLRAMSAPLLGHLDPEFLSAMDEIQRLLRFVFQTAHPFTIAVSGTGSAGMEAALINLIEPGDTVVVGINGVFGSRMAAIVERSGGKCQRIEAPWGRIIEPDMFETVLKRSGPVKAVALVQAETSTGVLQPIEEIGVLCRQYNALFVVDAVTSLGGLPVEVDRWGIDVCYSATQKCLSCPPGLAPLTLSDRAMAAIRRRTTPCQSWYFDLSLIADYWEESKRAYHHTAPISMLYGLREALRLVHEEGLETRYIRHRLNSRALLAGLASLGLTTFAEGRSCLPTLNCATVPPSVDEAAVRTTLLREYGIEIGGGLGALQGKVWRIGLMGESSSRAHVLSLLSALEEIGLRDGWIGQPGISLEAAAQVYCRGGRKKERP